PSPAWPGNDRVHHHRGAHRDRLDHRREHVRRHRAQPGGRHGQGTVGPERERFDPDREGRRRPRRRQCAGRTQPGQLRQRSQRMMGRGFRETAAVLRARGTRPAGARPRTLRGQALVLFLVLIGVLCLAVLLLFDSSQVVNKKVRLTNTADAAAYSVAVQQAKAYNFAAYMNRAQVGNEIAIAQLVSMWSWLNMLHTHTRVGYNTFTYLSLIPGVGAVFAVLARIYDAAEQVVGNVRNVFGRAVTLGGVIPGADGGLVSILSRLNQGYSLATTAVLDYVGLYDGYTIVDEVIARNDPTAEMNAVGKLLLLDRLRMASGHEVGPLRATLIERHERP